MSPSLTQTNLLTRPVPERNRLQARDVGLGCLYVLSRLGWDVTVRDIASGQEAAEEPSGQEAFGRPDREGPSLSPTRRPNGGDSPACVAPGRKTDRGQALGTRRWHTRGDPTHPDPDTEIIRGRSCRRPPVREQISRPGRFPNTRDSNHSYRGDRTAKHFVKARRWTRPTTGCVEKASPADPGGVCRGVPRRSSVSASNWSRRSWRAQERTLSCHPPRHVGPAE
jgi:hypothetical protein